MHYGIVNGPLMAKTVAVRTRRYECRRSDGSAIVYVPVSDAIFTDDGAPLMAVEGTIWQFMDGEQMILFAHPEHQPTLIDLKTGMVHPCEMVK